MAKRQPGAMQCIGNAVHMQGHTAMQPKKSAFANAGPEASSRAGPEATSMHGPAGCSVLSTPVVWCSRFAQDLQVQQQAQKQAWGKGKSAFKSKTSASYRDEDLPAALPAAATQRSWASLRMASSSCGSGGKSPFLCSAKDGRISSPPSHGPASSRALVGGQTCESSLNLCGSNQRSNLNLNLNLNLNYWPYPGSPPKVAAGGLLELDSARFPPSKSGLLQGGMLAPGAFRHKFSKVLFSGHCLVTVLGH